MAWAISRAVMAVHTWTCGRDTELKEGAFTCVRSCTCVSMCMPFCLYVCICMDSRQDYWWAVGGGGGRQQ